MHAFIQFIELFCRPPFICLTNCSYFTMTPSYYQYKVSRLVVVVATTTMLTKCCGVAAAASSFLALKYKVEKEVLALRDAVEEAFDQRCDASTLERCHQSNYDACISSFPNPVCKVKETESELFASNDTSPLVGVDNGEARETNACTGSILDYTTSSITFPPPSLVDQGHPGTDAEAGGGGVIESICFSQTFDDFFVKTDTSTRHYWEDVWKTTSPSMFFGSSTGAFRIYPARPQELCGGLVSDPGTTGEYHNENNEMTNFTTTSTGTTTPTPPEFFDPRDSPWYSAASSGPKNVVMILDASSSMMGPDLAAMKEAAIHVIDTLSSKDRIAIFPFATRAWDLTVDSEVFVKATNKNKEKLKAQIQGLEASGATNTYAAFERAFDNLEIAIEEGLTVDCNTAIMFATDGKMTHTPGFTEPDVVDYAAQRLLRLEKLLQHTVFMFTYSISEENDERVHCFPRKLACASPHGVWSKLTSADSMVESLAEYQKLMSWGLAHGPNEDLTTWVEPYRFSTQGSTMGVTVSAPAFDPYGGLIGVVGLDLPLSLLEEAMGTTMTQGNNQTMMELILRSTSQCPEISLTSCQMEAFRASGIAGDEARCNVTCPETKVGSEGQNESDTSAIFLEAPKCPNSHDVPTNVLANRNHETSSFAERSCCDVDSGTTGGNKNTGRSSVETDSYPYPKDEDDGKPPRRLFLAWLIPGLAVAFIILLVAAARRRRDDDEEDEDDKESGEGDTEADV